MSIMQHDYTFGNPDPGDIRPAVPDDGDDGPTEDERRWWMMETLGVRRRSPEPASIVEGRLLDEAGFYRAECSWAGDFLADLCAWAARQHRFQGRGEMLSFATLLERVGLQEFWARSREAS